MLLYENPPAINNMDFQLCVYNSPDSYRQEESSKIARGWTVTINDRPKYEIFKVTLSGLILSILSISVPAAVPPSCCSRTIVVGLVSGPPAGSI